MCRIIDTKSNIFISIGHKSKLAIKMSIIPLYLGVIVMVQINLLLEKEQSICKARVGCIWNLNDNSLLSQW